MSEYCGSCRIYIESGRHWMPRFYFEVIYMFGEIFGITLRQLLFLFLRVQSGAYGGSFPPPLSNERERECFACMHDKSASKEERASARCELIEHNLRLVAHIVKKYYGSGKNQDDLISIGTIGLIKAVDTFDETKCARFATYAGRCLQNEILMYFRSQKKLQTEVSMNETIDIDKDGNPLTWGDVIAVDDTIADDIDTKLRSGRAISIIKNELSPRERQILCLRYGLNGAAAITQREVADRLGISRSYVSRIEGAALRKVYESMERYSL